MDNNLSQDLFKEGSNRLIKTEVLAAFSTDHSSLLFSLDLRKDETEVKVFGNLTTL